MVSPADLLSPIDRTLYGLETIARILLAPLTLHLFLIFPRPIRHARWVVPFVYLPAALLLFGEADAMLWDGKVLWSRELASAIPLLEVLELYHLVLMALLAAGLLAWRLLRKMHPEPLRQATWLALGLAGGYLPFLGLYLLPRTLGNEPGALQNALAVMPLALVPLTFAYAILRYRLWDIGALVRSSVSLTLTVLVGVIGFSLASLVVTRVLPEDLQTARTMLSFVSGVTIAGLMIPTRRRIDRSLERIQYGSAFRQRRSLADFGRDLLRERDLGRLSEMLLGQLEDTFDLTCSNLLLLTEQGLVALRDEPGLSGTLPEQALGADFWDRDVRPLSGVELSTESSTPQRRLFTSGYRYAMPLRVREARLGVVVLGYKAEEVPLSSDDLDLIRNLLNQVSLAVENAQLLDEVKERLDEVSRLQHYSQEILASSPAGLVVLERDGRIESVNSAFARLVGLDETVLVGRRLGDLLPVEPLPAPSDGLREVSLQDVTGQTRHLQVSVARLAEEPGGARRVVAISDVTERVEMENALKERERLASLGMLAAGVAHEVNTPLTGISSYAQMLLADMPTDDPRRPVLEKMERQTFRASRIVGNLLEFSRERPGGSDRIDLVTVLDETLELLEERIRQKAVAVRWASSREPAPVEGNDSELQQVFTNLVLNAVDAMSGNGGGTLTLSIDGDDTWVRTTVGDDGPGIPADRLEEIFKPFVSTKVSSGGTGLGLAISRSIVRRHGGEIRVSSEPGEGCRFVVELPRPTEGAAP
ncbi:MAG: ATP-binding protein [Thermoanaerobaculia bacterium]